MKKYLLMLLCAMPILVSAQTASHLKASEQFIEVSGVKESFNDVINTMLKTQLGSIPVEHREKFAAVMKEFMGKYFNYQVLKPRLSKMYAEEFTEKELKELTIFYASETGKKFASKVGVMMQKGVEMGQDAVKEHTAELQEMMRAAFPK